MKKNKNLTVLMAVSASVFPKVISGEKGKILPSLLLKFLHQLEDDADSNASLEKGSYLLDEIFKVVQAIDITIYCNGDATKNISSNLLSKGSGQILNGYMMLISELQRHKEIVIYFGFRRFEGLNPAKLLRKTEDIVWSAEKVLSGHYANNNIGDLVFFRTKKQSVKEEEVKKNTKIKSIFTTCISSKIYKFGSLIPTLLEITPSDITVKVRRRQFWFFMKEQKKIPLSRVSDINVYNFGFFNVSITAGIQIKVAGDNAVYEAKGFKYNDLKRIEELYSYYVQPLK